MDSVGNRFVGTVKYYSQKKKFGFLDVPGLSDDIFVHISDVPGLRGLSTDHVLEFEIRQSNRGPRAENITKVRGSKGLEGIVRSFDPETQRGILRSRATEQRDTPVHIDDVHGQSQLELGWSVRFDLDDSGAAVDVVVVDIDRVQSIGTPEERFSKSKADTITGEKKPRPVADDSRKHHSQPTSKSGRAKNRSTREGYFWKGDRLLRRATGK